MKTTMMTANFPKLADMVCLAEAEREIERRVLWIGVGNGRC